MHYPKLANQNHPYNVKAAATAHAAHFNNKMRPTKRAMLWESYLAKSIGVRSMAGKNLPIILKVVQFPSLVPMARAQIGDFASIDTADGTSVYRVVADGRKDRSLHFVTTI